MDDLSPTPEQERGLGRVRALLHDERLQKAYIGM